MADKFECSPSELRWKYLERYEGWRRTLERRISIDAGLTLGRGKDGFSPPF